MMPNPWKEHATRESVPRWFYAFLYRSPGPRSEIARGLSLLVEGKYQEAIETLEPRAQGLVPDAEAASYLGIARYLSGDSSRRTLRLLESGTSSSRAGRIARWYLANALLTRGDVESATTHLTELATVRDWFGRAAKALLEKLQEAKKPAGTLVAG
jgi:Flp pilus assembly protein TadD